VTQAMPPQKAPSKAASEWIGMAAVGAVSVIVDFAVFNALLVIGTSPGWANLVALAVATLLAFLGNLRWTFRHREIANPHRSLMLFFVVNVGSAALVQVAVMVTAYITLETTWLNVVKFGATVIATVVRFWLYRTRVF
jgi:putative flippase GtrA